MRMGSPLDLEVSSMLSANLSPVNPKRCPGYDLRWPCCSTTILVTVDACRDRELECLNTTDHSTMENF